MYIPIRCVHILTWFCNNDHLFQVTWLISWIKLMLAFEKHMNLPPISLQHWLVCLRYALTATLEVFSEFFAVILTWKWFLQVAFFNLTSCSFQRYKNNKKYKSLDEISSLITLELVFDLPRKSIPNNWILNELYSIS